MNDVITSSYENVRNSGRVGDICEEVIVQLYRRVLTPNSSAIDGGANTGWHSFGMADRTPSGRIYAIEPLPVMLAILRERAERYNGIVEIISGALSDHDGAGKITYFHESDPQHPNHPLWHAGISSLSPLPEHLKIGHDIVDVDLVRLDTIIDDTAERIDFIKLDIEGAEYNALKGGMATIRRSRPLIVIEDGAAEAARRFDYEPAAMMDLLGELDYGASDILGTPYTAENWLHRDRWRPYYSILSPNEKDYSEMTSDAVMNALNNFKII